MGSRGSVIPFFLDLAEQGVKLPITSKDMTRFNITLQEGVDMVLWCLQHGIGGEIFVPKIPSYRIMDLAEAINPGNKRDIVGIRPGEKIHELMITSADSLYTLDLGNYYAILPPEEDSIIEYLKQRKCSRVDPGFSYDSGTNEEFLDVEQIRTLITNNIDPNFIPFQ